jgi:phosphate-selective porin OprO/OprP
LTCVTSFTEFLADTYRMRKRHYRIVQRCAAVLLACAWPLAADALTLLRGVSEEGRYDLRLYGRLQEDAALFDSVPDSVETRSAVLSRAWSELRVRWRDDWIFRLSGDFARRAVLDDLSLEYRGWPVWIQVGRFPEPFSLGASINAADTLLLSRPSPTLLGPAYGFGAGINMRGDNWGFSTAALTRDAGRELSGKYPENALSMRATWRPLRGESGYLHIGASASLRQTRSIDGVLLAGSAESGLLLGLTPGTAFQADATRYRLLDAETAARLGPVMLIGEYVHVDVAQGPAWNAAYVEGAWALTGERRGYSTRYGTVGGITPNHPLTYGGPGAWEFATRWSLTDLREGGGDLGRIASLGLNWYPVDPLRITMAAEHAYLELGNGTRRSGNVAQLRFQILF